MEEHPIDESPTQLTETSEVPQDSQSESPEIDEASSPFLGRWNRLISTTNWEKGRIIWEWREALSETDASAAAYTDEVWSQQVGNVTPQHVGRLRRVYGRFGTSHEQYAGLFWSHFQASVDWPDAEMWLEGAVQNDWSISQMRNQRWQAIGGPPDEKPRAEDIIASELDEDVEPTVDAAVAESISPVTDEIHDEIHDADPLDDDPSSDTPNDAEESYHPDEEPSAEPVRPFEDMPPLPPDLNEAFEAFKLSILHHKLSGWEEVSCDGVLAALSALRELALAPSEG